MAKMKYWNGTTWEILDAKDADTIDGKHFTDIQSEIENKVDITDFNNHKTDTDVHGLRDEAVIIGKDARLFNGTDNATGCVAIGADAQSDGGNGACVAVGGSSYAYVSSTAVGVFANAEGAFSTAIGTMAEALNSREGMLGGDVVTNDWIINGSLTVDGGSKNFEIPHPNPAKKATHKIRHAAVESPTPGDTLYRWQVEATQDNDVLTIDLPDYFIYLNTNVQIFVTPQGHFGIGYGTYDVENEQIKIHCQYAGKYNVLVIGTRNDENVQDWYIKGVEREVGESWLGETYTFKVDEIIEVEELKEV